MADINKLKIAGFHTVKSLVLIHPKKLKELKGFSEAKVEKVIDAFSASMLVHSVSGEYHELMPIVLLENQYQTMHSHTIRVN
eukprot:m.270952 g.270952  ORF g.270952 m.270952 type:complete len:82 (-) comp83228_c0_seq1:135-380(-)